MTKFILVICILANPFIVFAQERNTDSLRLVIAKINQDSNRVNALWQLAHAIYNNSPEQALQYSQEAVYLARRLKYTEGESRALGILANTFLLIGNYPRALETNLAKLQIEEKRNNHRNRASVLLNIGAVYAYQEDYRPAMEYYYRSDSLIEQHGIAELSYYSSLNLGDAYEKLDIPDSAYYYFGKSLAIAEKSQDTGLIGTSQTGLAHVFRKQQKYDWAKKNYASAIEYLRIVQDDDVLCEAMLGCARMYGQINMPDSAEYFARQSYLLAQKDGFLNRQLDAAYFLSTHYRITKNTDSTFVYLDHVQSLNDSVNSKARVRELQVLSSNERFRQIEIEESRMLAAKETRIQLQLLLIGVFIVSFFILTLLLSRIRIPIKTIRVLGILSLLLFFEYLTLWLHPTVKELTHHTPVYEILIFVCIAAILIPAHHKIEHWLINKLIAGKVNKAEKKINRLTRRIRFHNRP